MANSDYPRRSRETDGYFRAHAKRLPQHLVQRYPGRDATTFADNQMWYRRLAEEGQRPRAMVVACCDSRVHVSSLFSADQGDVFVHRNIAALVPPYAPDGDQHGTSAAVEYAVSFLKVAHLIVMGHSQCGGVQGCVNMCEGNAPELEAEESFVGRWMDILRPAYDQVAAINDKEDPSRAFEKLAVMVSPSNLMGFPFIKSAVEAGRLMLHGFWTDIGGGGLEHFDSKSDGFRPV